MKVYTVVTVFFLAILQTGFCQVNLVEDGEIFVSLDYVALRHGAVAALHIHKPIVEGVLESITPIVFSVSGLKGAKIIEFALCEVKTEGVIPGESLDLDKAYQNRYLIMFSRVKYEGSESWEICSRLTEGVGERFSLAINKMDAKSGVSPDIIWGLLNDWGATGDQSKLLKWSEFDLINFSVFTASWIRLTGSKFESPKWAK